MKAQFEDWLAITETKARYCRFADSHDWENYAECFTEDVVFDFSAMGGPRVEGRDIAIARIRESIEHSRSAHHVHNPEMRFDGEGADVIWAMQDRVEWITGPSPYPGFRGHVGYGHYHERYVKRRDGGWRIKSVKLVPIHLTKLPLEG
jgi:3-phenylpropionate/cinnamic acid dioxygenase small subunit